MIRKFIFQCLIFSIGIFLGWIILYASIDAWINRGLDVESIYIWGDSQTYQGIDIDYLSNEIGKPMLTAAQHGAGVYDFLVFVEKVPRESKVIVNLSRPCQLRRISKDRSTSGISLYGLFQLYLNGYSVADVWSIVLKNYKPKPIFSRSTSLYSSMDIDKLKNDTEGMRKVYKEKPSYLDSKQNIMRYGIEKLIEKRCEIQLISFPFHPIGQEIEDQSIVKGNLDSFDSLLINDVLKADLKEVYLKSDIMHDLTHLNKSGARLVAEELVLQNKSSNNRIAIKFHHGDNGYSSD